MSVFKGVVSSTIHTQKRGKKVIGLMITYPPCICDSVDAATALSPRGHIVLRLIHRLRPLEYSAHKDLRNTLYLNFLTSLLFVHSLTPALQVMRVSGTLPPLAPDSHHWDTHRHRLGLWLILIITHLPSVLPCSLGVVDDTATCIHDHDAGVDQVGDCQVSALLRKQCVSKPISLQKNKFLSYCVERAEIHVTPHHSPCHSRLLDAARASFQIA